jgi:glycosyltransferase involved in cell wall biosynthesis
VEKILIVSEKSWPDGGGAEFATYLISKILAQNFDVTILTGSEDFSTINIAHNVYSPFLKANNKFMLWLRIIENRRLIEKIVRQHDVLYIPRASFPMIPIAKKLRKKVIVHFHDYIPFSYNSITLAPHEKQRLRMNKNLFLLERRRGSRYLVAAKLFGNLVVKAIRKWIEPADEAICASYRQRDIILLQAPWLSSKLTVVHNPLPPLSKPESKLREQPLMLYLSGDSYIKGFNVFLSASQKILKQGIDVKFVLAGKFGNSSEMLLEKLNHEFYGAFVSLNQRRHKEILGLYSTSHALLFPSINEEPSPYTVLEAMLSGTIPIASDVGGIPEIVKGTFAERMLFEPKNVDELVDRIKSLVFMPKERIISIGFSLREAVLNRFDPEVSKHKLLRLFQP